MKFDVDNMDNCTQQESDVKKYRIFQRPASAQLHPWKTQKQCTVLALGNLDLSSQ